MGSALTTLSHTLPQARSRKREVVTRLGSTSMSRSDWPHVTVATVVQVT